MHNNGLGTNHITLPWTDVSGCHTRQEPFVSKRSRRAYHSDRQNDATLDVPHSVADVWAVFDITYGPICASLWTQRQKVRQEISTIALRFGYRPSNAIKNPAFSFAKTL